MSEANAFEGWFIVEQMGHKRMAGYIRSVTVAGAGFICIDVPSDPPLTQLIRPETVYCLTPCTEETARGMCKSMCVQPINRFDARRLLES